MTCVRGINGQTHKLHPKTLDSLERTIANFLLLRNDPADDDGGGPPQLLWVGRRAAFTH